jgi:quinolinate synthase
LRCLVEGKDQVDVDPETARLARAGVQRMIEIGTPGGDE